ncbi:fimbrillin family protein [Bacteroides sp. ET489]|uniref:fimbrillin family protein n=1 Tax=Bacteroides sp. ET489 TaxID=3057126 RepID=UPI0026736E79|nr:fimbrillin family protein [Bacteroides sp. ET489]MDO3390518.1 fimbrillin family protein [Bacteroides sp. ET489]
MKQTYILTSLLCLTVLLMPGCTSPIGSGDDPSPSTLAINFGTPQADTRAAVNSSADMGNFSVWGGYDGNNVFNQVTVHSPGWTYDGGTRYWIPGKTYNFYAVHPAGVGSCDSDGTITIEDFDCSKTGNEAVDLMTARATGLEGSEAPMVGLKFGHELAQVKVSVESNGATVDNLKVYGVSYKGKFNSGSTPKWTVTEKAEENITPLSGTTALDMLLLPATDLTDAKLKITYHYGSDTSATRTNEASLAIAEGWAAGQQYHYKVSIVAGKLTITVTVADWKEEDTSVSWQ